MRTAFLVGSLVSCLPVAAGEPADCDSVNAARAALRILKTATDNYPQHRDCFSCHHQTLPLFAAVESHKAGLFASLDEWRTTAEFTVTSFDHRRETLAKGQHVGGRASTVSYGLLTYHLDRRPADDTTAAMVEYLLQQQRDDGSWKSPSVRPPLEKSLVTCTVLSAAGIQGYATPAQSARCDAAIIKARQWLQSAALEEHEDVVFALWGETLLGTSDPVRCAALVQRLQSEQREDGGWSQLPERNADAYATGQAVWCLLESSSPVSAEVIERGVVWLRQHQEPDGSWHVKTRSKPIQEWFDNGDPHGEDQFISIAATSWATAALARYHRTFRR
ncbi:MAG TPA: prenyltransferase/squalene oxidase repeat-containing protein [Planctomycetaceae bacterium]|nr:prenyltransferase/squalene oxidase repeat-containing protein [Planctomycetaceae bacterium]